jgi:ring-1,2-phenylacetyl-CoA epoxidase subunit PaaC
MSAGADAADVGEYALRLGDDALILSQRLSEWASCAPELEEDVALTNIALDLLGQARNLFGVHRDRTDDGRDEDQLAFGRNEREFLNLRIVEQTNGDFAYTIVRQLLFSSYQFELYSELSSSVATDLAAVAAKAVKEVSYHRDHAVKWTIRLGDGTDESHRRMADALTEIWPYTVELFESDALVDRLSSACIAADPEALRRRWEPFVDDVLSEATLSIPSLTERRPSGGRQGRHGEVLGFLLAEMQWLHRAYPGVQW